MKTLYAFLRGLFAIIGLLVVVIVLAVIIFITQFKHADKPIHLPDHMTLTFTLSQPMVEKVPAIIRAVAGDEAPPGLEQWITTMEIAAHDPRVAAVYIRAVGGEIKLAQIEELRASMARLRAAGKQVIFYADTFGEMDNGTGMYYLASAASKIVLQPAGLIGFAGVGIEEPFARSFLDRNGILPEFEKRRAYKSAMDMLTEKTMTPEDRAQLSRLVGDLADHILSAVSADRHVDPNKLSAMRDQSPLTPDMAPGLIDAVQYEDQIQFPAERISWTDYADHLNAPKTDASTPHIAILEVSGEIVRGQGGGSSAFADSTIGAEDFVKTLADIEKAKDISAVIIRLNSPGGSAIASETMNRAVQHLKDTGRPVIVSMGEMAASGGYYLAAPATWIVAEPSTLTGSIGVIVGKLSFGGLSDQYGVHWDEITAGKDAAMFATGRGFNPDERAAVARSADAVYNIFKTRVAAGRKLSPDVVEQLAQGQVWTGEEAKANGLVDELGGLIEAIAAAKKALNLTPAAKVAVEPYEGEDNPGELVHLILHQLGIIDNTRIMGMLRENLQSLLRTRTLEMQPLKVIQ